MSFGRLTIRSLRRLSLVAVAGDFWNLQSTVCIGTNELFWNGASPAAKSGRRAAWHRGTM